MTLTDPLPKLDGRLLLPGDDGFDDAGRPWNRAIEQRPAAVAEVASVADVQAVIAHARAAGLRVAAQATGHGAEALDTGALGAAVLVRTHRLDGVAIDREARTARIGAGATAGAVARAAGEHGLAPVLGLAPSVGVAGLALGGGIGWLSRVHGLAANNIISLDVVTADGAARRVDAGNDPDLFFALRGGGGGFAIVTALEVALHAVDEVSAGALTWPAEHAPEVLEQVRRVAPSLPDAASVVARVLQVPPLPEVPEAIRSRRIVMVVVTHLGPHADGERLIAPLRGAGGLSMDTFGPIGPGDLVTVAGDPEEPGPARGEGLLLEDLTTDVLAAVHEILDDPALAPLGIIELRQLGGALGRPAPAGHGAIAQVEAGWVWFAGGFAPDGDAAGAVLAAIDGAAERLAPFAAPGLLLNGAAHGADPARAFAPEAWARLGEVKRSYDPDGLILAAHGG
jgi:FAD/FMN-containing dehydrogenase